MAAQKKDERNLISVTVILGDSQPHFLDGLCHALNEKHELRRGAKLTRSHLLRAMIEALQASGQDLTLATTEDEVRELLTAAMKSKVKR
jgi:hypothetical protein